MSQLEDLLQQCTVKLSLPGRIGWGTGFFVAPGWILTCHHVVWEANGQPVQVQWQKVELEAVVEKSLPDPYDLALLRVNLPTTDTPPCVYLDEDVRSRDPLYLFGYPDEGDRQGEPRTFNCDGITGSEIASILFNLGQVRPGMSGSPLLNQRTGKVCGIVKFTRDRSINLGGGAIPTRAILEQFPELRELQRQFHGSDRRWSHLLPITARQSKALDAERVEPYLRSLIANERYQQKWGFYTPTDAVGKIHQPKAASKLDIGLMVQLMQPKKAEGDCTLEPQEKTERLPVLEGIRKYAAEHVLLMGRPGSGKSTALLRLLVEEAEQALVDRSVRIPVLVELRYLDAERPSVLERIEAFLRSHGLDLESAMLKQALTEGRLLLLVDGVNELPSEAARRAVTRFRQDYPKTAMVFTTRDVALGGDLGIEKKLEMQPLSETQMRQFVQAYLPEQGEPMLRQLQRRLREVGQTPLLLWMLCQVFQGLQQIPSNLGLLFRWFAGEYDKLKRDVPVSEGLRYWQTELLQHLAFTMMQAEEPTEFRVAISRQEAETVLAKFLQEKVDYPTQRAKEWLEDLLEHHLIQPTSQNQLEFHHQLLQEYYAAEYLLRLLPNLTDEQLKRDYLNYLKWTEPVALMLALEGREEQALRVVQQAMQVDLRLGARFAGVVRREFQDKTLQLLVQEVDAPKALPCTRRRSELARKDLVKELEEYLGQSIDPLKMQPVEKSTTEKSKFLQLLDFLQLSPIEVVEKKSESKDRGSMIVHRLYGVSLVKHIKQTEATLIENRFPDEEVFGNEHTSQILKEMEQASSGWHVQQKMFKPFKTLIETLKHGNAWERRITVEALGKIGGDKVIKPLIQILKKDRDAEVRQFAAEALGRIGSEIAIPPLLKELENSSLSVSWEATEALCKLVEKYPEVIAPAPPSSRHSYLHQF